MCKKPNPKQNHFAQNYSSLRAILGTGILLFFKNKNKKIYCKIIGAGYARKYKNKLYFTVAIAFPP